MGPSASMWPERALPPPRLDATDGAHGADAQPSCAGGLVALMAKAVCAVDGDAKGNVGLCFNRVNSNKSQHSHGSHDASWPVCSRQVAPAQQAASTSVGDLWDVPAGNLRHSRGGAAPGQRSGTDGGCITKVISYVAGAPADARARRSSRSSTSSSPPPRPWRSRSPSRAPEREGLAKGKGSECGSLWPLWADRPAAGSSARLPSVSEKMRVSIADLHIQTEVSTCRLLADDKSTGNEGALQRVLRRIVVFPGSWSNLLWEGLGGLHIAWDVVMIPMTSFDLPEAVIFALADWSTTFYWSLDIPYQFFVSYEEMGVVEKSPKKVALNYLKTWFLPDLSIVVLDWVIIATGTHAGASRSWRAGKIFKAVKVIRAVRLVRLFKMIRMMQSLMDKVQSLKMVIYMKVAYLTLGVLLCAHYICCYWYLIASMDTTGTTGTTWVKDKGLESASVGTLYLNALFWSLAQSGFASIDVHPTNEMEQAYASGVTVTWLLLVMVVLSTFTIWALQLRDAGLEQEKQEAGIRTYLTENQVTPKVRNQCLRFFRLNYKKLMRRTHEADIPLFNDLPVTLRVELHKQAFMPTLGTHPLFAKLNQCEMDKVCHLAVEDRHYPSGRKVFARGDEAKKMIFVISGDLSYYLNACHAATISSGEWISEIALWRRWRHVGWLLATTSCEVLEIDASRFRAIMAEAEHQGSDLTGARMYARMVMEHFCENGPRTDLWDDSEALSRMAGIAYPPSMTNSCWVSSREMRRSGSGRPWRWMWS